MNIGDKVRIKSRLRKCRISIDAIDHHVKWHRDAEDIAGVYLGKTLVYEGRTYTDYSNRPDRYFEQHKRIVVAVVQPLDAGGRYRRPVYALPEDVELQS